MQVSFTLLNFKKIAFCINQPSGGVIPVTDKETMGSRALWLKSLMGHGGAGL